ncbi:hypothetical protein EI94DRAFT_1724311 [Lactarius quietus]|nr:hypothetical protein EI94DRAFT_1724311 [Lactarius quietus]
MARSADLPADDLVSQDSRQSAENDPTAIKPGSAFPSEPGLDVLPPADLSLTISYVSERSPTPSHLHLLPDHSSPLSHRQCHPHDYYNANMSRSPPCIVFYSTILLQQLANQIVSSTRNVYIPRRSHFLNLRPYVFGPFRNQEQVVASLIASCTMHPRCRHLI